MSAAPGNHQPWPMKWILVAIVLLIVPYTIVTLRYRKPGPAFEPYEDIKNRVNVSRLLAAGYQRIPIAARRPAEVARTPGGAAVSTIPGGLPPGLRSTLVEPPQIPLEILSVTAAPATVPLQSYAIELTCSLSNDNQQLGGAELYVLGADAVIMPTFEPVADGLVSRSRQAAVLLIIPAGALKPGPYTITVVGERASRAWPLDVR